MRLTDIKGFTDLGDDVKKELETFFKDYDEAAKKSAEELNAKLTAKDKEISGLNEQIKGFKANPDVKDIENIKASYEKEIGKLKDRNDKLSGIIAENAKKAESEMIQMALDSEVSKFLGGFQVKSGITERTRDALTMKAKEQILAAGVLKLSTGEDGSKYLEYFDHEGKPLYEKTDKGVIPCTTETMLASTILADILEKKRQVPGVTNNNHSAGGGGNEPFSAKSQIEADEKIREELIRRGMSEESSEFAAESMRLRNEYNVGSLPMR